MKNEAPSFPVKIKMAMQYRMKLCGVLLLGKLRNNRLKLDIYSRISLPSEGQQWSHIAPPSGQDTRHQQ